jgi:hypothetical protein
MPPQCDSLDGPVVTAAHRALAARDVDIVLPYVPKEGEAEVAAASEKVIQVREGGPSAREVADRYFYETVVRIHRASEGAPYTGLKPAGLGHGPVVPVAESAIRSGSPAKLVDALTRVVAEEVEHRFERLMRLKSHAGGAVDEAREYVEAMLGLEVWAHSLYECTKAAPHGAHHEHE